MAEHTALTCAIEALHNMTSTDLVLFRVNPPMWHPTCAPTGMNRAEVYALAMELAKAIPKVLIVVDGGVADFTMYPIKSVNARLVDLDNDPRATVPSGWEILGQVFDIPTTPETRSPEVILQALVEAIQTPNVAYNPLLQEAKACLDKLHQSKP
jgi:hypothetical protein